jgi:uncharacterized membrane protein
MSRATSRAAEDADLLRAELWISRVLRWGVLLSGSVIAVGLAARLLGIGTVHQRSDALIAAITAGREIAGPAVPTGAGELLAGLRACDPDVVIALGLLLLILLPVARVGMTVLLFLAERDWTYLVITLFVFSMLISSLLLGKAL